MKKKLLGSLIALGGSLVAVGSAFALYTGSLPENKSIQIGTKTSGDVNLVASVKSDSAVDVNPENQERLIKFNAGFQTPNENSVYIQPFYYAHLEFKISSENTSLISYLKEETWVKLGTQVDENEDHPNEYGSHWKHNTLNGVNVQEATDHKSLTWGVDYPLFKGADVSEFEFHIRLDTDVTKSQFLALDGAAYTIDFNVSDAQEEQAYIVGMATGGWEEKADYRMTINAKADHKEWMFKTGTVDGKQKLADGGTYKLKIGSTYCCGGDDHVWSSANNNKTFYWNGSSASHGDLFN